MIKEESKNKRPSYELLLPKKEIEKEFRKGILKRITNFLNIQNVAFIILGVSILIGAYGYFIEYGLIFSWEKLNRDFYSNISTELLSIFITVLVIDRLIKKREVNELKRQLIRELKSNDNATAIRALHELRARNWALDGSIRRSHLLKANLKGAYLKNVDLSYTWLRDANFEKAYMKGINLCGAVLVGANLKDAKRLSSRQLSETNMLLAATMPNGSRYDGRFNLEGDIKMAESRDYKMSDPESAARFYGVSLDDYTIGQEEKIKEDESNDDFYLHEDWLAKYLEHHE